MSLKLSERVTVPNLVACKGNSKIAALTAYDFTTARIIDRAGIDLILVGDSLCSVVQGETTTLPVTLDEMVYHCRCVTRAVERALVVGDLPFMSYQVSVEQGLIAAGRLLKEGRVGAVKLEGGAAVVPLVERLVAIDIPVVGHVGLTPQSYHRMGGHKIQGVKHSQTVAPEAGTYERVLADAKALELAGVFCIVVEGVPDDLAAAITAAVRVPTIGIGAGENCDGQILVTHDMLGMTSQIPKFVKRFAELGQVIERSVSEFCQEVRGGVYPRVRNFSLPSDRRFNSELSKNMQATRKLLRCKIHRATVTHADLAYEGSITLPPELLEASGLCEYEAVNIWDVTNGARIETYAIRGEPGSGVISINGAAAHLVSPGDVVIIAAFDYVSEAEASQRKPTVVFVDEHNCIKGTREEIPGPQLMACR